MICYSSQCGCWVDHEMLQLLVPGGLNGCTMGGSLNNHLQIYQTREDVRKTVLIRITNRSFCHVFLCIAAQYLPKPPFALLTLLLSHQHLRFLVVSCSKYCHTPRPHKPKLRLLLRYTCKRWRGRKRLRIVECPRSRFCFSSHTCHRWELEIDASNTS